MKLRPWKIEDIDEITEMEKRCFADPWSRQMLADCLTYPVYDCILAEEGGQVCGYGCLIALFEEGEIANIAVDLPYRGRGIAKALLNAMQEIAKAKGANVCLLEVRKSNTPAIALYEGFGYERYGERANYYGAGEDAILMRKQL